MGIGNPNWEPGKSGNPAGRPRGTKNKFSLKDLQRALKKAKASHGGVSLLDHLCDKAYSDNVVAIAILKKMYPDLKQMEARVSVPKTGYAAMTPAEAAAAMDEATTGGRPNEDADETKD